MTEPTQEPTGDSSTRRVVFSIEGRTIWQVIGAILATLFLLWAAGMARSLLSMVVFALFLSLAMQPAVNALHTKRGMRRGAAVGIIYLGGFIFLLVMTLILIPMIAQLATLIRENGTEWLTNVSTWASDNLGITIGSEQGAANTSDAVANALQEWGDEIVGVLGGIVAGTASFIFWLATVAMFAFYFTAQAPQLQRAVLSLFSPTMQERIGWTWDRAVKETGGYFYSRMILMLINGMGFFFTMVLVGVPTLPSIGLALIGAFIAAFIPAIGTYIGSAIPIAITLALEGWVAALIVLAYALLYQQLENYVLSPKISAGTMSLNGGLAFGSALFGGAIAGPLGAFMALPVAAVISSFISNFVSHEEVVYQSPYANDAGDASEEMLDEDRPPIG